MYNCDERLVQLLINLRFCKGCDSVTCEHLEIENISSQILGRHNKEFSSFIGDKGLARHSKSCKPSEKSTNPFNITTNSYSYFYLMCKIDTRIVGHSLVFSK